MPEDELFAQLSGIMDALLGEGGCPWDRAQTHESLRPFMLEESYEVADAIDHGDMAGLCEELGDVLMEVVFHAKLAARNNAFTLSDVLIGISQKLVQRHSHIFGADKAETPDAVEARWEINKNKEKNYQNLADMLKAVPKAMPALMRAEKVQKRAKLSTDTEAVLARAHALLDAFKDRKIGHIQASSVDRDSDLTNLGELLFLVVQIAVILEINAEFSLTKAIEAFINSNV